MLTVAVCSYNNRIKMAWLSRSQKWLWSVLMELSSITEIPPISAPNAIFGTVLVLNFRAHLCILPSSLLSTDSELSHVFRDVEKETFLIGSNS